MPRIGVVLSGCAGKGAYEIGCMLAIREYFGAENIKCISSASMGAVIGHPTSLGRIEEMEHAFREMDSGKFGRHIMAFSTNPEVLKTIGEMIGEGEDPLCEHYVSSWNFTDKKVEYVPFHTLRGDKLMQYMQSAISIPIFSKGVVIDGKRRLDGAFLDNIPVYPLTDKDLDVIFCIYFDNAEYLFESKEFDQKIIKLSDFPNNDRLEVLVYEAGSYDRMKDYGYQYTKQVLSEVFDGKGEEEYAAAVADYGRKRPKKYKKRLTADVVLNGINAAVKNYSGALTVREKLK